MNNIVKTTFMYLLLILAITFTTNCSSQKKVKFTDEPESTNPYNPVSKMGKLIKKTGMDVTKMHFLVFGDSKGNPPFKQVLKRADSLNPQFCLTTADLVVKGGGERAKVDYAQLDKDGGWFMKKYPMWPTVGNHESFGGDDAMDNFNNFFGMSHLMYSFEYGNAKFIALPWPKIKDDKVKLAQLEDELKSANGKMIFIFKHRPHYDVGSKKYKDVEGVETIVTKLYDKYNVVAVFSGHDHIYYRTKRNNTNYIISAGAGAPIYPLKKEKDAIKGDAYYGKRWKKDAKTSDTAYKFVSSEGVTTGIAEAMYYVVSVKIDGKKVSIEMIDAYTGKVWDKAVINE
ncbi:MAG: metallophosphoesterase [Flavobacteriales bacterium]|nr:metallophosphoesterase [Flavobacteriales bacterium]